MTIPDPFRKITEHLPKLTKAQLFWLEKVVANYSHKYEAKLFKKTLMTEQVVEDFGNALRTHHSFSQEACSKDKFEYMLEQTLLMNGRKAKLAGKGNPGHDITIDGQPISLKSQANKNINAKKVWISKFHELGKGDWTDKPEQLEGLRLQFLNHLNHYERIFTLRCLSRAPDWKYQLLEIPKELLLLAKHGTLEMRTKSKQMPKPGYCFVEQEGKKLFSLYFDGGTERKLQIKNLLVDCCVCHAEWKFYSPKLTPEGEPEPDAFDEEQQITQEDESEPGLFDA